MRIKSLSSELAAAKSEFFLYTTQGQKQSLFNLRQPAARLKQIRWMKR